MTRVQVCGLMAEPVLGATVLRTDTPPGMESHLCLLLERDADVGDHHRARGFLPRHNGCENIDWARLHRAPPLGIVSDRS